jgi:hypothetical protein
VLPGWPWMREAIPSERAEMAFNRRQLSRNSSKQPRLPRIERRVSLHCSSHDKCSELSTLTSVKAIKKVHSRLACELRHRKERAQRHLSQFKFVPHAHPPLLFLLLPFRVIGRVLPLSGLDLTRVLVQRPVHSELLVSLN